MSNVAIHRRVPNLPLLFAAGVALTVGLALVVFWRLMRPPLEEVRAMASFLAITASISIVVGYSAYRLDWMSRSPRLSLTLVGGYALASILTFINVGVTAVLMFINRHDLMLASVLLLFAGGIAMSLGYFLSTSLTDRITRLNRAAQEVAQGRLAARVTVTGRDEMADLAHTFNAMAAQLEAAARKQSELDTLRRDLVAWIGHDVRTPLASVRVIVEALADGVIEDPLAVERYLQTAQQQIGSLSLLLDDLFEMAQIDAGGMKLERHPSSIGDLISDTIEGLTALALRKGVSLEGSVAPDVGPISMDVQKIGRVLTNLLNNALQHTPSGGGVQVRAVATSGHVQVEVCDTGVGIHAEDLPYVLEQFYRGEKSRNRATGGAGLGLAIAQGIIKAHGGDIRVESAVGQGTCVRFTLPV